MENVFGVLRVFMFISLPSAGRERVKRVNLSSIPCDHADCKAKLEEFREANFELARSVRIHAEFTFTDLIH